jgi:hypothetical protein
LFAEVKLELIMFGSHVLETIIGIAFIFLTASVFASVINEGIASIFSLRAKDLECGLKNFLAEQGQQPQTAATVASAGGNTTSASTLVRAATGGKDMASGVLNHPLVQSLCAPKLLGDGVNRPSYLDAKTFTSALFELLVPDVGNRSLVGLRTSIQALDNAELRATLLPLVDSASGDLDRARLNIERAFDAMMDRLSGRYKRRAQVIILAIGLALAIAFNIDALRAAQRLWQEQAVRDSVITQASSLKSQAVTSSGIADQAETFADAYRDKSFPVGWTADAKKKWPSVTMILGWLLTAVAVSFGAPFWFDFLNKIVGLNTRLSGSKPQRTAISSIGNS